MTDWPRHFTAPEMWYSEKDSGTQPRILQMERSWFWPSTEMTLRNPNPLRSSQPEEDIPNNKQRNHWTTIHLRILQNQRTSHTNWLAFRHHLEKHGSHRLTVVAATVEAIWHSLHNWPSNMRNSGIWFVGTLQRQLSMNMRMASTIWSVTNQQLSLCSPTNGIWRWKKSQKLFISIMSLEILWSFRKGETFSQVIRHTGLSVMEQAMCSSMRPGKPAVEITKSKPSTTRLGLHWLLTLATLGCHSQLLPSTISQSIKWTSVLLSWKLTWKKRSIYTHCRNSFVSSKLGADTTIQD